MENAIRTTGFLLSTLLPFLAGCSGDETVHNTTIVATGPFVSAVSPPGGDTAGGTAITISGSNFVDGAAVEIGGAAASNVTFVSDSEITADTPAGAAGPASVKVTNPDGKSGMLAASFTYADPPALTSVSPGWGPTAGGTTLTLTGTGFQAGATVHLGTELVFSDRVTVHSTTSISVVAPPHASGALDVTVTHPDAQASTLASAFLYNDPPSLAADLPAGSTVRAGEHVAFQVTVSDADGDAVNCVLINPPPGCFFHPVTSAASPATAAGQWLVTKHGSGTLVFEASDSAVPSRKTRLTVPVKVSGGGGLGGMVHADVTGDGIPDTIGKARLADAVAADAGALYVWEGSASPSSSPKATLIVPGAVADDHLGYVKGQGLLCADVTGDGILDVVAGACEANVGGVSNAGAVYVWAGGPGLSGAVSPTATLTVPGAVLNDFLCDVMHGQGLLCADVTGDGILDIVAGTCYADVGGVSGAGAVYVWAGGSGLSGAVSPTATLTVPGAVADDYLCNVDSGQGLLCADVTGDGILDIVAGASYADVGGVSDAGAVYLWAGGSGLSGAVSPTATLTVPGAAANDEMCNSSSGQGLLCADVTGDGILDVVAGACWADVAGVLDAGAVYVWAGGTGLSGALSPTATLTVPGASTKDWLCYVSTGQGLLCADVTGDGILDIVAGARDADVGGVSNAGAVYVWAGGTGLSGAVSPTATLTVPGASTDDILCYVGSGQGLLCADVTGDGILDIVAGAILANRGGLSNTGAIYLWQGGSGLTGTPGHVPFIVPNASSGDRLGF